jgi:outer membrane protein assembly factor BamB
MLTERGVFAISPQTQTSMWEHEWPVEGMNRSVQPNVDGDRVFLGTGFGLGTRAIKVTRDGETWSTDEEWTSKALKPYYNDFLAHEGHLYGFDGNIFACADIETGERKWKRGRYGHGQVLLLADQGLLLVLSEQGEVVLVSANPEEHEELAKIPAISGKTWNHPVIAHGKLFVRNAEEAACFALPILDDADSSP